LKVNVEVKKSKALPLQAWAGPNSLKVDKGIIFFKLYSKFAPRPTISIVNPETNNK
jgi:hypothetical protein